MVMLALRWPFAMPVAGTVILLEPIGIVACIDNPCCHRAVMPSEIRTDREICGR
jgi:hypothetical protein